MLTQNPTPLHPHPHPTSAGDLVASLQSCGQYADLLQVGQEVCLPGADAPGCANVVNWANNEKCKVYIVQQGDTLNAVADSLKLYGQALSALNQDVLTNGILQPNKYLKLPPWIQTCGDPNKSGASCRVYTVQSGDFIAGIAAAFRVATADLLAVNRPLTQDAVLQNGQPIRIPPFDSACGAGIPTKPPTDTVLRCRGYRVNQGDDVQKIAQAFKTTVSTIYSVNPELVGVAVVQPGTVIKVPPYDSACESPTVVGLPGGPTAPTPPGAVVPLAPPAPVVASPPAVVVAATPPPPAAPTVVPLFPSAAPAPAPAPKAEAPALAPVAAAPAPAPSAAPARAAGLAAALVAAAAVALA